MSLDRLIYLQLRTRLLFAWWLRKLALVSGMSFLPIFLKILMTDASLSNWGRV